MPNPIKPPTRETMFTIPLQKIVWLVVKLLFKRTATSPSYLGISWATIAIKTGMASEVFPVAKATPSASPSMKL
jgi:hypothetical protein